MPRQRVVYPQANWKGMYYATDVGDIPPGYALFAQNMIPRAGVYWRRPSFRYKSQITSGTTSQMGGLFVLHLPAGDVIFAVYGGEIYGTAAGGTSFSKLVSSANLSSKSIGLTTSLVFGCQFGSVFVFNDATNQPFTWDGTSGAGGLTKLTNAPSICYGTPVVYYGKLFFIKASVAGQGGTTIVWSEENQANVGYEATISGTTYNNAWTLTQMGSGPIYVLLGTNDGLYYFREGSIGVIRGTVTPDFQAAGVHDNVSLEVGSRSPKGVVYHNGWIWFQDGNGHPYRIQAGTYQLQPLWLSIQASFWQQSEMFPAFSSPQAALQECSILPVPALDAVLFLINQSPDNTATIPTAGSQLGGGYLFDATTGDCWCNLLLAPGSGGNTVISGCGITPGIVHNYTSTSGGGTQRGIGIAVGCSAGSNAGWNFLRFPEFGQTAYDASWPDGTITVALRGTPQGDIDAETRHQFTELRATFALSGVPSGTATQAVSATINTKASTAQTTLTSQNIANSATGVVSERVTKVWGLSRELPYCIPGITTSTPAELGWGITELDLVAYPLAASPAWSTT